MFLAKWPFEKGHLARVFQLPVEVREQGRPFRSRMLLIDSRVSALASGAILHCLRLSSGNAASRGKGLAPRHSSLRSPPEGAWQLPGAGRAVAVRKARVLAGLGASVLRLRNTHEPSPAARQQPTVLPAIHDLRRTFRHHRTAQRMPSASDAGYCAVLPAPASEQDREALTCRRLVPNCQLSDVETATRSTDA